MLIIGTHFFSWGSDLTADSFHCGECGTVAPFILKSGMRFITLFFIIPLLPISTVTKMVQCPNCSTRYQSTDQESKQAAVKEF